MQLLCCLFVLSACAVTEPKTLPLAADELIDARQLWAENCAVAHPTAVDADARLNWDILGRKGGVGVSMQVQKPGLLRFSAQDPLGRALILAVANQKTFTLMESQAARVYQGQVTAAFWQKYLPSALSLHDLLALLGAFVTEEAMQPTHIDKDAEGQGFWYRFADKQARQHAVLLDQKNGTMQKHLLFDPKGTLLVTLHYADYRTGPTKFSWPWWVQISGPAVTGTLTFQIEQIYSHKAAEAALFHLTAPPHFIVEQVL